MSTTSRALRELLIEKAAYQREAVNGALDDILLACEQEEAQDGVNVSVENIYALVARRLVTSDMRSSFDVPEDEEGGYAQQDAQYDAEVTKQESTRG